MARAIAATNARWLRGCRIRILSMLFPPHATDIKPRITVNVADHIQSPNALAVKDRRAATCASGSSVELLELRVLRFGFFQDGDIRVGVLPQGEEPLVSGLGFRRVSGEGVGSGESEMRQRAEREVGDNTGVIEKLLKLSSGSGTVTHHQLSLAPQISGIHRPQLQLCRLP